MRFWGVLGVWGFWGGLGPVRGSWRFGGAFKGFGGFGGVGGLGVGFGFRAPPLSDWASSSWRRRFSSQPSRVLCLECRAQTGLRPCLSWHSSTWKVLLTQASALFVRAFNFHQCSAQTRPSPCLSEHLLRPRISGGHPARWAGFLGLGYFGVRGVERVFSSELASSISNGVHFHRRRSVADWRPRQRSPRMFRPHASA